MPLYDVGNVKTICIGSREELSKLAKQEVTNLHKHIDDEVEVKTLTGEKVEDLYAQLNEFIDQKVSAGDDPEDGVETEVEFDIDSNLKYGYTVRAIEAVSGKQLDGGKVKKLIEKIKLKDNTQ